MKTSNLILFLILFILLAVFGTVVISHAHGRYGTIRHYGYTPPTKKRVKPVVEIGPQYNPNKYDKETKGWVRSFPIYKPRR